MSSGNHSGHSPRTRPGIGSWSCALILALLCALTVTGPLGAAPPSGQSQWTGEFETTSGRLEKPLSDTRIGGGKIKLGEEAAFSLGPAVPGEMYVNCMVAVGEDVFTGTGPKGHLVHYDADELYQEGYQGPSHYGVSSSKGQAVLADTDVTSLATNGSKVFGGTGSGKIFVLEDLNVGTRPHERATCPGGSIAAMTYAGGLLYCGTQDGHAFTFDPGDLTVVDLGQPDPGSVVNAMASVSGTAYLGSSSGKVFKYSGGSFIEVGTAVDTVNSMAVDGTTLYAGTETQKVFSCDTAAPAFVQVGGVLGSPVRSLAFYSGAIYAGMSNGRISSYRALAWNDEGTPFGCNGKPVNALAVTAAPDSVLYGGTGENTAGSEGKLFRMGSGGTEQHAGPAPAAAVTGIAFSAKTLYLTEQEKLYSYTSPGTYAHLSSASSAINDVVSKLGIVYMALEDGKLGTWTSGQPSVVESEIANVSPANCVLLSGSERYLGLDSGQLIDGDDGSVLATAPAAILDLASKSDGGGAADGTYAASGNMLLRLDGSAFVDTGTPCDSTVNAIAVNGDSVFAGCSSGKLYRYHGSGAQVGDAASPVRSMCAAAQGVELGTEGGNILTYDGTLRDEGVLDPGFPVTALCHVSTSVWAGSGNGNLFSRDDAHLGDLGAQVKKEIMVWSMAYDPDRKVFYAGTYQHAHFLVIDPVANTVTDLGRPVPGEREIEDILVTSGGLVVGATYGGTEECHNPAGGHVFQYDPATGDFTDRGKAPAPDNNWWISSLVECDGLIYGATSNSASDSEHTQGRMFSLQPSGGWPATDLGAPVPGEGTRSLTVRATETDSYIYGATWKPEQDEVSSIYRFDPSGPAFTHLGDAPPVGPSANKHVNRLRSLGGRIYCAQNNGFVFSFDPLVSWDPTTPQKPVPESDAVYPLAEGQDSTLLCGTSVKGSALWGHLVSYDPSLSDFRDVDVTGFTEHNEMDEISAIATGDPDGSPMTLCGTRGSEVAGARHAGTIFKVLPYRKDTDASAVSTAIDTRLSELQLSPDPLAGPPDEVAAVCTAPGPARQMYVAVNTFGGNGKLLLWDIMTHKAYFPVDVPGHIEAIAGGPDGFVYIGTGNAGAKGDLYRYDPGNGTVTCLNMLEENDHHEWVRAIASGPDGKVYFGTGSSAGMPSGRLFRFDPASPGTPEILIDRIETGYLYRVNRLAAHAGKVYGVAGAPADQGGSAQFFICDPVSGPDTPRNLTGFGSETIANTVVAAGDGKLYVGTGPLGKIVSYDPATHTAELKHDFAGSEVTALAASGADGTGRIYGCAGSNGGLFRYTPGGATMELGPISVDNSGVPAAASDGLGNVYLGGTGAASGQGRLFQYDPNADCLWDRAGYAGATDPGTTLAMSLNDEAGGWLKDLPDPDNSISDLTDRASVKMKAVLRTTDSAKTPESGSWSVTWWRRPSVDKFEYPHAEGIYRGESLRIWGSDFGADAGTVTIDGQPATVEPGNWHEDFIIALVPQGASAGMVAITRGDSLKQGKEKDFNLLSAPHIASIQPPAAQLGEAVEVRGSGFQAARGAEDVIEFNGIAAVEFTSWSDTLVRARVPAGASTGDLVASINGHSSNAVRFTLLSGGGPEVGITQPLDGAAVKGTVKIAAAVTREGGGGPVEMYVDGVKKGSDPAEPFEFTWNADSVPDGAHQVEVRAVDGYGRTGSDSMTLYVDHTVPSAGTTWYFAEGCTDYGFETWVLIENPGSQGAETTVSFMDEEGGQHDFRCVVQPRSRTTVNAADVAPSANVSVKVASDRQVVCERSMYWGSRIEGHATTGTTTLSRNWYFAEGSTDWGFETYVLLGNPGTGTARADLHYLFKDGTTTVRGYTVGPRSRLTVNPAEEVGAKDFSLRIESDEPMVAERSMYHGGRRCGTATIGCQEPATTWYLSEGSTDWGFETWVLIERPAAGDARVHVSYRKAGGDTVERDYVVAGNSRHTLDLSKEVGVADVSTQVTSDLPVVCERSMYWNARSAGHCSIGSPAPGRTWNLAEGCTDYGFETWVLLDNPQASAVSATLTFMKEDGTNVPVAVDLAAHSRVSVDTSTYVGAASFSTRVDCASPIMVERSMYWNARGGGTGSIGAR